MKVGTRRGGKREGKRGRRGIGPGRSLPSFPVTHAAPLSPPLLSTHTEEFYVFVLPISNSSTIAFLLFFLKIRYFKIF
jgi:hypothetical protein